MSCGRQGGSLALRLLHGTRTAEAIAATSAASQIRLAEVFASTIAEHAGIVAAAAIFSIGHVSGAPLPASLNNLVVCTHAKALKP